MKRILFVLTAVVLLASCQQRRSRSVGSDEADAIEERLENVAERQADGLRQAEEELPVVDRELQEAQRQFDSLHQWVMDHAADLNEQSAPVRQLNRLHARRDSLQLRFDLLCNRIKYIHRQQQKD